MHFKKSGKKLQNNIIYVLGAENNALQKLNSENNNVIGKIELQTGGFSSGFHKFGEEGLAVVTDLKNNMYSIVDLNKGKLIKTYSLPLYLSSFFYYFYLFYHIILYRILLKNQIQNII